MNELPAGTVTFLFTDIEGSTNLLRQLGELYASLLADHHRLLREIFIRWNGREVGTEGDSFFVSFPSAADAVGATVEAQRVLATYNWPEEADVRVRMGLHTGEPWTGDTGYVGMDVHRAARVANVGYGGQVLLSETTTSLIVNQLPEDVSLLDLGRHRLKDLKRPERIRQLVIDDLPADFPPLKTLGVVAEPVPPELDPPELPAFLHDEVAAPVQPTFVGRDREMAWLKERLELVLQGQDQVVFVTGEAGMGKSSLLGAFARQAAEVNPDLLVTWGQGNAFSGQGDPYLPFREVFAQLCGNVEGPWRSGLLDGEAAGRLWTALPETAEILSRDGGELLENFVSGKAFLRNLAIASPNAHALQNQIRSLLDNDPYAIRGASQPRLFEQVAAVLASISTRRPLLIILDDLQWVDRGSVDLLFQLGRQLSDKRLLIVVGYRPEDVAAGRERFRQDGGRHLLQPLVEEFKRLFGEITLDLSAAEGRSFVDVFIDSEPNKLDLAFRERLFGRTGGHALFTVELLRDMQERGDLVRDEKGRWAESHKLDWDKLPAQVEGVIESRIGRLEESLRDILAVAAVEGESFTAQVVARVQEVPERKLLHNLSRELSLKHRLVSERQAVEIGKQMLARYRFAHALFQRYLYNEISPMERRLLHGEIAVILEEFYGDERDTIAFQLARHYLEAGDNEKAMDFLLKAGDQARQILAYQEAIEAYQSALSLAGAGHEYDKVARILMKLGLSYSLASEFENASETYQKAFSAWQKSLVVEANVQLPVSDHPLRHRYEKVTTLDPQTNDAYTHRIVVQLFSGLAQMSMEGDVIPDVAKRWDILDYGKTYVFYLRQDVRWRDGHPVTAHDFEFAWKRVLSPNVKSASTVFTHLHVVRGARAFSTGKESDWSGVGVRARDDHTLEVELERPIGFFLQVITLSSLFPVPKHVVSELGENWAKRENLVSNGPFFVESWSRETANAMTLVRNPKYHGQVQGNVGRVEMPIIWLNTQRGESSDASRAVSAYHANQLDVLYLNDLPRDIIDHLIRRFAEDYVTGPHLNTGVLVVNPSKPPFDNRLVRRATAMAINKKAQVAEVHGMLHEAAQGGFLPPGIRGHSPDISLPFDPEKARQLLRDSGIAPGRDHPPIIAAYTAGQKPEVLNLVSQWRNHLDLNIMPKEVSWNDIVHLTRPPHLFMIGWSADYADPTNFIGDGLAYLRNIWSQPNLWDLIDEARVEINKSRRLALCRQADKILIDEAVIVPLHVTTQAQSLFSNLDVTFTKIKSKSNST